MKIKKWLILFLFLGINSVIAQLPLNSLDFDGNNDYVSSTLPTVFNDIANNDFTIETWIKPNGSAFARVIFAQLNATNFASISLSSSNQVYFYVNNVSSESTSTTLPSGVWSHIACTWDASTSLIEIYINGTLATTSFGGTSTLGNNNVMAIGAKTNGTQFFTGELDELRIWDVIRNPCQISIAMNSEFTISQPNLVAYYNFNQGTAGGTNAGITSLPDFTTNYDGTLLNFGLTGASSNWLASGATINAVNQISVAPTTDVQTACNSYTWIDGNTYTGSNSTATYTLTNTAGCDSVVTLDLTMSFSNAGTDVQTACNSYTWIDGNTYTN
ncbi:MAG: LamG domain-containing protein, partial [Flavobacteriales bacterium]|nr:LamG domain-containing protein [Flavobacteriales bacterium]